MPRADYLFEVGRPVLGWEYPELLSQRFCLPWTWLGLRAWLFPKLAWVRAIEVLMLPEVHAAKLHPTLHPGQRSAAGMRKKPGVAEYGLSVDRVIEPGLVGRERKITVVVGAGSARLRLQLEPEHALRLADGILAALREMGGRPILR
jgi:hypothetical protein